MIRKLVLPSLLSLALPAGAAFLPATVETAGANVTTTVLSDQSTVVTFLADGTLTLTDDVTARALFVGGGGGGGSGVGGGPTRSPSARVARAVRRKRPAPTAATRR